MYPCALSNLYRDCVSCLCNYMGMEGTDPALNFQFEDETAVLTTRQCQVNGNRRKESSIHCWGILCTRILYTENFIPAMYGPFPSSIYIPYIIDGRDEDK